MKKNSQLHIWLETELKDKLEKEAIEDNVSLCELCRQKLIENPRLLRIEMKLEDINKKLNTQLNFTGGKNGKRIAQV